MTRLILHIGANKTGTSAIQSALARARDAVAAAGIHYPAARSDEKAAAGYVTGGNAEPITLWRDRRAEGAGEADAALAQHFAELAATPGTDRVLFSSEALSGFDPGSAAALARIARQVFDDVQVVYFVRSVADHAVSQYAEHVKRRSETETLSGYLAGYTPRFVRAITNWEGAVGADALSVFNYDEWKSRVTVPLLRVLGADEGLLDGTVEQVNRTLSASELEVLRALNLRGVNRNNVAKMSTAYSHAHPDLAGKALTPTAEDIAALDEAHAATIEFVNSRIQGAHIGAATAGLRARAAGTDGAVTLPDFATMVNFVACALDLGAVPRKPSRREWAGDAAALPGLTAKRKDKGAVKRKGAEAPAPVADKAARKAARKAVAAAGTPDDKAAAKAARRAARGAARAAAGGDAPAKAAKADRAGKAGRKKGAAEGNDDTKAVTRVRRAERKQAQKISAA